MYNYFVLKNNPPQHHFKVTIHKVVRLQGPVVLPIATSLIQHLISASVWRDEDEMFGTFLSQYLSLFQFSPQANRVYYLTVWQLKLQNAWVSTGKMTKYFTTDHLKLQYAAHSMPMFTNQADAWCFIAEGYQREERGKSSIISHKNWKYLPLR